MNSDPSGQRRRALPLGRRDPGRHLSVATSGLTAMLALWISAPALAQTASTDREIALKHAGCVTTYATYLELAPASTDEAAKGTARALQTMHRRVTVTFAGAEDGDRMLRASKASMQMVLTALEKTSDPEAIAKFLDRRFDACVQHLQALTDEQQARVEKAPKP